MITLKHKDHGYHIVYTEADAKRHTSMGWKRCDMEKEHELNKKRKARDSEATARENALQVVVDIANKADAKKATK